MLNINQIEFKRKALGFTQVELANKLDINQLEFLSKRYAISLSLERNPKEFISFHEGKKVSKDHWTSNGAKGVYHQC